MSNKYKHGKYRLSVAGDNKTQNKPIIITDEGGNDVLKTSVATTIPNTGMKANTLYNLGELSANTTFTLAAATDNTIANVWMWTFSTGDTAPTITWPAEITMWQGGSEPTIKPNTHYVIKVMDGFAVCLSDKAEYVPLPDTQGEPNQYLMLSIDGKTRWGYPGDPRMIYLPDTIIEVGDMLFYDKFTKKYTVVKKANVASVLTGGYDTTRYETNFDSFIGTIDGMAHFVAHDDAAPTQELYSNDVAATSCYYRIEIDNTQAGSITFSVASGNGSIDSTTITWEANEAMATIVAKFTSINPASNSYIAFAGLEDGTGVGLEVGGYGANTMTVTDNENCTVIDCSTLAFFASENPAAPGVGGTFVPTASWMFIGNAHHNWRGDTARTILGQNLVADSTTLIANDGYNYSYRCGCNFAKFKSWASVSGESTFIDDGEGGSIANPGAHVMNEATFNLGVRDYTGEDSAHLGMKEYYTHLTTDATGDFAALRATYEARYGQMTSMYDAYLMSHIVDPGANSGIANSMRNKGKWQTEVKADAMNVTYNYVILPAYPPEYNAAHYGSAITEGFQAGAYYHPEPGDVGLFLRDDIMAIVNANITLSAGGTQILNTVSRGSCADYSAYTSWYFLSSFGCVSYSNRFNTYFRSRPVLALPL